MVEQATRQMLQMSLLNMPESADSERPRTYVPRNPYPTPNSFPQTPAAVFDAPRFVELIGFNEAAAPNDASALDVFKALSAGQSNGVVCASSLMKSG